MWLKIWTLGIQPGTACCLYSNSSVLLLTFSGLQGLIPSPLWQEFTFSDKLAAGSTERNKFAWTGDSDEISLIYFHAFPSFGLLAVILNWSLFPFHAIRIGLVSRYKKISVLNRFCRTSEPVTQLLFMKSCYCYFRHFSSYSVLVACLPTGGSGSLPDRNL